MIGLSAFVKEGKCISCGKCVKGCPTGAIALEGDGPAEVDENSCVGCMRCLRACPVSAIGVH